MQLSWKLQFQHSANNANIPMQLFWKLLFRHSAKRKKKSIISCQYFHAIVMENSCHVMENSDPTFCKQCKYSNVLETTVPTFCIKMHNSLNATIRLCQCFHKIVMETSVPPFCKQCKYSNAICVGNYCSDILHKNA